MMRFFKNLMARARKPDRRHSQRLLERQYRPKIERLEERMAPSSLYPGNPCSLQFPHNPS
jgi:hypothetical protein